MTQHQGLPVKGYVGQSPENVAVVNTNKELEERVLRQIDSMQGRGDPAGADKFDQRMVALARTQIQQGFMWLNRAVFQPERVSLPEDAGLPHAVPEDGS